MAFQIILGITQLVSAIYLTINFYKKVSNFLRNLLKTYWLLTILIFIALTFNEKMHTTIGIIIYFIVPMLTATLFMFIFYKCRKEING